MKKKFFLMLIGLIIIGAIVYFVVNHISIVQNDDYMEYTPEEELSDSQSKETTINLYFLNTENN